MITIAMVIGVAHCLSPEWKNGLAWVIIGGLLSSLFLTQIVAPVMHAIFDKLILNFNKYKKPLEIEELMIADYEHRSLSEEEFTPAHL